MLTSEAKSHFQQRMSRIRSHFQGQHDFSCFKLVTTSETTMDSNKSQQQQNKRHKQQNLSLLTLAFHIATATNEYDTKRQMLSAVTKTAAPKQ